MVELTRYFISGPVTETVSLETYRQWTSPVGWMNEPPVFSYSARLLEV